MYHEFFESPRYYNMMFDAWETKYSERREEGTDSCHVLRISREFSVEVM
jgi:hypothetical protein